MKKIMTIKYPRRKKPSRRKARRSRRQRENQEFARELVNASVAAWQAHRGLNLRLYATTGAVGMLFLISILQYIFT